jgi:chemosensory pili system protein ChpC
MSDVQQKLPSHIYSVLVSLVGANLILPNSAVAEVLGQEALKAREDGPSWLVGQTQWEDEDVPIISFEAMMGQPVPALDRKCRVVVLHAPARAGAFGIITRGYPLIVTLNEVALKPVPMKDSPFKKLIFCQVSVANRSALIPDLDALAAVSRRYLS